MSTQENQPLVTQQTIAQNEAVENVLARYDKEEIVIPRYQRDADQWERRGTTSNFSVGPATYASQRHNIERNRKALFRL